MVALCPVLGRGGACGDGNRDGDVGGGGECAGPL